MLRTIVGWLLLYNVSSATVVKSFASLGRDVFLVKRQHTPRGADNRQSPEQGQNRTEQSTGALSRRGWPRQQRGPPRRCFLVVQVCVCQSPTRKTQKGSRTGACLGVLVNKGARYIKHFGRRRDRRRSTTTMKLQWSPDVWPSPRVRLGQPDSEAKRSARAAPASGLRVAGALLSSPCSRLFYSSRCLRVRDRERPWLRICASGGRGSRVGTC